MSPHIIIIFIGEPFVKRRGGFEITVSKTKKHRMSSYDAWVSVLPPLYKGYEKDTFRLGAKNKKHRETDTVLGSGDSPPKMRCE